MSTPPNPFDRLLATFDHYQRQHGRLAFVVGLIKKINEDEAGQRAALLTYYGFLSLFPLLLILTSVLKLVLRSNEAVRARLIEGVTAYVPVIGGDLQRNVQGFGTTGLAFVVGFAVALYGARGVADVLRGSLDRFWVVPHKDRPDFLRGLLRSAGVIAVGGVGLVLAPIVSGYALGFGHAVVFRLLSITLMTISLFWVLVLVVKLASSRARPLRAIWRGSAAAAIGLELLQLLGGLIVTRQLKHLDSLYGTFAIVLGLFYWIYLQAQVIMYGFEFDTVRAFRLWPRSLQGTLTEADHQADDLYAKRSQFRRNSD